jgi:hypothetical protein
VKGGLLPISMGEISLVRSYFHMILIIETSKDTQKKREQQNYIGQLG